MCGGKLKANRNGDLPKGICINDVQVVSAYGAKRYFAMQST